MADEKKDKDLGIDEKEKDLGIQEIQTDELEEVSGGMCACAGSCQCPEPPVEPSVRNQL